MIKDFNTGESWSCDNIKRGFLANVNASPTTKGEAAAPVGALFAVNKDFNEIKLYDVVVFMGYLRYLY